MTSQEINDIFEKFSSLTALIIGDVMIDSYMWGDVERMSPEAPVPIVAVTKREQRLGGAANVALNVQSMGATPLLCSTLGDDPNADAFVRLMKAKGMETQGILTTKDRITTTKTRVIGNKQHVVRVDEEVENDLRDDETTELLSNIIHLIEERKPDVIIFEDYDKGVITKELITKVISTAVEEGIPVTVDPKRKNFSNYSGATLFKPNLKELVEGANKVFDHRRTEEVKEVAEQFRQDNNISIALITLSEKGVLVCSEKGQELLPAHLRDIADVSGAGDTVITAASLCLALGLDPISIAWLSNLAGGLVCEQVGVVPITLELLKAEASRLADN